MPNYYLDSSAILKRFRTELGSSFVEGLYESHHSVLYSTYLSVLEVRGVFARLRNDRRITNRLHQAWKERLDADAALRLALVSITDDVVTEAVLLTDEYALKAADAVQLASAILARSTWSDEGLLFVSGDRRLLEAARLERFDVLNPDLL